MQLPVLTRTEQVRRAILHQILTGTLRPGERLLEGKLSKELGVSQATVNAALQDLHNQGLVSKLLNRSTNVSRYTLADIEKLFAVRVLLEPAAVAALSAIWSEEAQDSLQEQVNQMRRAARTKDLSKWGIADYTFHQEIYRLSGNPYLMQAGQAIAAAPFAYILCDHLEALPTDYLAMAEDHQEVLTAIAEGPEAAARVTRHFLEEWLNHSRRALREVSANGSPAGLQLTAQLKDPA
uniref:Transcriptional regulator, GntR family n=1 Tax=Solibacter usitatus (strain Ellin6076) TaxID=234267 RepID=Q02B97_SOLUE